MLMRLRSSIDDGRFKGFGGCNGLFGTDVKQIVFNPTAGLLLLFNYKKTRCWVALASLTPVPNNPVNPPNLVRTLIHRCQMGGPFLHFRQCLKRGSILA
jgi:hypothetical protein